MFPHLLEHFMDKNPQLCVAFKHTFFSLESYELHSCGLIDVFEEKPDKAVTQVSKEKHSKH